MVIGDETGLSPIGVCSVTGVRADGIAKGTGFALLGGSGNSAGVSIVVGTESAIGVGIDTSVTGVCSDSEGLLDGDAKGTVSVFTG